jgi:hypothetical protein
MRELMPELAASMREAISAIRENDFPRLQRAVESQKKVAQLIAGDRASVLGLLRCNSGLIRELSSFAAVLSQVVRRSSQTVQALLFVVQGTDLFYSPEGRLRR